jgi:hypothetical protein
MPRDYTPTPESGKTLAGRKFAQQTRDMLNALEGEFNAQGAALSSQIEEVRNAAEGAQNAVETTQGNLNVHAADNSAHGATTAPTEGRIAQYSFEGVLNVGSPTEDANAANKSYVDGIATDLSADIAAAHSAASNAGAAAAAAQSAADNAQSSANSAQNTANTNADSISSLQTNISSLQTDMTQAQSDIAELQTNSGGGSGDGGTGGASPSPTALSELVKNDAATGDIMIKQILPTSPIQLKAGLVKAFQYVPDGESAVDVVRTYDNTASSVFAANNMLVFSAAGTHIKVEFEDIGTDITPNEAEYTLYQFNGVDLTEVKELEIL